MKKTAPLLIIITFSTAQPALAYIGPGAGLGAIGTAIGVILAILLLSVGFIWYPLRRFLRRRRQMRAAESGSLKPDQPDES